MSNIKQLKQRFESIDDMRTIITAMKTLAFIENKKLSRYLVDQGRCADSTRQAAADFLSFYPLLRTSANCSRTVIIAVGADRGFCGNFNEQVVDAVRKEKQIAGSNQIATIAVGDRLLSKLQKDIGLAGSVSGATFAEEVPAVLSKVARLVQLEFENSSLGLVKFKIIGHQYGQEAISAFEPFAELQQHTAIRASAPNLTLSPDKFFPKLLNQYFQFVLYYVFYSSLMAENVKRIMHLDTALQRLEQTATALRRHYNQARQEEITEEIEILIMNMPDSARKC